MYAGTKARSPEGMPGVCRGYFGTSPYRDPPSSSPTPNPIFSTPSIGEDTLLRQVCDSYASLVSNVNNQRVGTCTQEKVIETFGTSSTHPLPLFSDESIQCFAFLPQLTISVCMMFIFRTLLFVAFGHLPSFSSNPLRLCHRTTIISSKFVPWKLARNACQMLGKNSVRGNWKQIHVEYAAAPLWGGDKSQWGTYNGGEKAKLWFSTI